VTQSSESSALSQAFFVARAEAVDMLLSLRAAFLVVTYGAITAVAGGVANWLYTKTQEQLTEAGGAGVSLVEVQAEMIKGLVEQGWVGPELGEQLSSGQLPLILLLVLKASGWLLPGLILLIGFNRISGDISSRFTRYVLQRVHRGSYLAGKVVGHWLASFGAVVVVQLGLLAVAYLNDVFDHTLIAKALPRIWVGMALFTLVFVAYTQLCAALFARPFVTLLLGLMILVAADVGTFVGGLAWEPVGQVWVGDWDTRLWMLDPVAVAVFLAYAAAFVGLAQLVLRKRDL
jgi:hypothetical protein